MRKVQMRPAQARRKSKPARSKTSPPELVARRLGEFAFDVPASFEPLNRTSSHASFRDPKSESSIGAHRYHAMREPRKKLEGIVEEYRKGRRGRKDTLIAWDDLAAPSGFKIAIGVRVRVPYSWGDAVERIVLLVASGTMLELGFIEKTEKRLDANRELQDAVIASARVDMEK